MDIYNRCCACGHKTHAVVMGGRVPDTEPCSVCQSNRRNTLIGGAKPAWYDEPNDEFVARHQKSEGTE